MHCFVFFPLKSKVIVSRNLFHLGQIFSKSFQGLFAALDGAEFLDHKIASSSRGKKVVLFMAGQDLAVRLTGLLNRNASPVERGKSR